MAFIRIATERLYLALFWIARTAFLAQGLAMSTAMLAAPGSSRPDAWPWLRVAFRSSLAIGATLFVTGVLLVVTRHRITPRRGDAAAPSWPWPLLLGLSLAVLPAAAYAGSSELFALWREIAELLNQIGFFEELKRGSQFSGIVMLPILVALFVPLLEASAAFFLIAAPLGLLVLLTTRSRLFPKLLAMLVACQAGLVLASLLAADAFSRVAAEAIRAMAAAEDAEVHRAAETLAHGASVLESTAAAFVTPLLGYLVWLPALLLSRQVGAYFGAGSALPAAPRSVPAATAGPPAERGRAWTIEPGSTRERHARVALVALGLLLLASALPESLEPRLAYVSSQPAPGSTLASPPGAIRVSFDQPLDPSSSLSVIRTTPGEQASPIAAVSSLDPDDAKGVTLRAELPRISGGLFRVDWHARPAASGIARGGTFYFGVELPVPEVLAAGGLPLQERDVGQLRSRKTIAGGAILIALGALLPWLPRKRG